ncbi:DNA methyltransferase [Aeromonas veronii]|uniref:DNA methyltransferase n=1 Tax=Aeromonas veronii TaxID=654 RepID=UPI003A256442
MQQDSLFSTDSPQQDQAAGPVTCLGKTFANDQARRDYFLAMLAEKLKDPEFRKIEGFPIGSDEDILNLSDPPYYTACPNPWIGDFIAEWEAQKTDSDEDYHREPFAFDVTEGKHDPIYRAHPFHTKVPHKAIMRYILHYTQPGDIVFDGFCGTGMTGVAAQMCEELETVKSLGYKVSDSGYIFRKESDADGKDIWLPFSRLGSRKVILNDLSPVASMISYCYTTPFDAVGFKKLAQQALNDAEIECGWLFETKHDNGNIGKINYTIWSDVFVCHECAQEVVFWDSALEENKQKVLEKFQCPHCNSLLSKKNIDRAWTSFVDFATGDLVKQAKSVPVLINYSFSGKRFDKKPDSNDLEKIQKIETSDINKFFPTNRMMEGKESRRNDQIGITNVHHFYTKQNLWFLASFLEKAKKYNLPRMVFTGPAFSACKMYRWTPNYEGGGPLSGTLFIPSLIRDIASPDAIRRFINKLPNVFNDLSFFNKNDCLKGCSSLTNISRLPDNSLDYCFIDPPFGANLNYSELNFLWESWLRVWTNYKVEAIENLAHNKDINNYRQLMLSCFKEVYRALKPGRWVTVEFSNTKASVWNSIQTALADAGFIVANVSALDKKQGSFKAVTTPTAVKQDLIISAYKPSSQFEERFIEEASSEEGIWDFIRTHLSYLPVIKKQAATAQYVPERDPRILFDQVVAYYVRKGLPVPISSPSFQIELSQRFIQRDGMFFLEEQAAEYDKWKALSGSINQSSLFVKDEASAIDWLRQLLRNKPQTFADINPLYMQQLSGFSKHEVTLDLRELLSQNFLCYDGQDEVPDQIHSYLSSNWKELRNLAKNDSALIAKAKDRWYLPDPNKAGDLEKLREKSLLKEFEEYKAAKKKLKVFRIEAVRVGFKKLWEQQEFAALIAVAEKLPSNVLEEDPVLLMYYDQAVTLSQVDADDEW